MSSDAGPPRIPGDRCARRDAGTALPADGPVGGTERPSAPGPPPTPGRAGSHRAEVTLRVVSAKDARALSRIETRDRRYLEAGAPRRDDDWVSVRGQRQAIAVAIGELRADRAVPLVIEADGELVGRISLNSVVRGAFQSASLGYWVRSDRAGQGIATHAVRQLVDLAFGAIGLHRLQAEVQVGNDASVRVLERCGFVEYGTAPQYLRLGGAWRDCRLFQRIDATWEAHPREDAASARRRRAEGDEVDGVAPDGADGAGDPGDRRAEGALDVGLGTAPLAEPLTTEARRRRSPREVDIAVEVPGRIETRELYAAAGWTAYAQRPEEIARALVGSAVVVTARHRGTLVGLARVVGDGAVIAYLQDVLVAPGFRRQGIGRLLVDAAFAPFAELRQHVLLTDAEPGQRAFYEELGFTEVHDARPPLRAFVRMR